MVWKKGLIAGVVMLILGMGVNMLMGLLYPPLAQEIQNPAVYRSWSDPLMWVFFAYPIVLGVVLAYLWDLLAGKVKGKTLWEKAMGFANIYVLVATLPGMFITFTSMQVSFPMILSWSVLAYLDVFAAGVVFLKVT